MTEAPIATPPAERPTSATVSWVWIVLAVLGILSTIDDYLTARRFAAARPNLNDPAAEATVDRFENLIGGTPLELAITTVVSAIVLTGAIGLLKLRSWGRRILVAITWLSLVGTVIGVPILAWEMTDLATWAEDGITIFDVLIWFMALLQIIFGVTIFGLMLRSLHGKRLRDAILPK